MSKKVEERDAASVVGRLLSDSRDVAVLEYAKQAGLSTSTEKDREAARAIFYRLPYQERRQYHVRPDAFSLRLVEASLDGRTEENSREAAAVVAYRKSGDASHAMRVAGVEFSEPWVEQKRNSQGVVEILASEMMERDPDGSPVELEDLEIRAREEGLYEGLPANLDEESDSSSDVQSATVNKLLAIARERLPQQYLAVFLLVEVDGKSLRQVVREFELSFREIKRILRETRTVLQSIALEETHERHSDYVRAEARPFRVCAEKAAHRPELRPGHVQGRAGSKAHSRVDAG